MAKDTKTVSSDVPVSTSTRAAKQTKNAIQNSELTDDEIFSDLTETVTSATTLDPADESSRPTGGGGLAAAIARAKTVEQKLDKKGQLISASASYQNSKNNSEEIIDANPPKFIFWAEIDFFLCELFLMVNISTQNI